MFIRSFFSPFYRDNYFTFIMYEKILLPLFILAVTHLAGQSTKPYKVIAYYTGNGETIQQYPVKKLTHIIFSFLKLQNDTLTFHNDNQRHTLEQLVLLKKHILN